MNKQIPSKIIFIVILICMTPFSSVKSQETPTPYPTIDGIWSPNEWPSSIITSHIFNDHREVQFGYRINQTHIFMTARYQDTDPSFYNKTCTNPLYTLCSDSFAVGFDINGDRANMGTKNNPDDSIYVGLYGNSSVDVFMQGIGDKIVYDTEVGGTNDTYGKYSYANSYFTFEMVKKLKSGDIKGHDIELNQGSDIYVMLAYWNDLPPRTEISGFSEWIRIIINDPLSSSPSIIDYIVPLVVPILLVLVIVLIKRFTMRT